MVINTNVTAQSSADLLAASSASLSKSLQRLSSGAKIVSPDDDAAGLAVSMKFEAYSKRTSAAITNISNAISYTKTQDGYLAQVSKALNRMSELAVSAQDVTKTSKDQSLYNAEFAQLAQYIGQISEKDFNGVSLFDNNIKNVTLDSESGTWGMAAINLGDPAYSDVTGTTAGGYVTPLSLIDDDLSTSGNAKATTALDAVKLAVEQLAKNRSTEGASLTRLNYSKDQLTVQRTNIDAAKSVITDVDVATESTNFAKQNILVQSGTAMLAQANTQGQSVLRLLG